MAKFKIAIDRANAGTAFDIADKIIDAKLAGGTITDAIANEIVDRALTRYGKHVRAALARAEINIDPDEAITADVLLREVNAKSGMSLQSWSPEAMLAAAQKQISASMSDILGVQLEGVDSVESLKAALINAAKDAVSSGKESKLIPASMIKKLRVVKTMQSAGVADEVQRKKMMNRWYQKKYRRSHKEVWVSKQNNVGG